MTTRDCPKNNYAIPLSINKLLSCEKLKKILFFNLSKQKKY